MTSDVRQLTTAFSKARFRRDIFDVAKKLIICEIGLSPVNRAAHPVKMGACSYLLRYQNDMAVRRRDSPVCDRWPGIGRIGNVAWVLAATRNCAVRRRILEQQCIGGFKGGRGAAPPIGLNFLELVAFFRIKNAYNSSYTFVINDDDIVFHPFKISESAIKTVRWLSRSKTNCRQRSP